MKKRTPFLFFIICLFFIGCSSENENGENKYNPKILTATPSEKGSTPLGNFVATAVQEANKLDFVFLPSDYFQSEMTAFVDLNMQNQEIEKVVDIFENGPTDDLLVGTMKGKHIKTFIINRSREYYRSELEVAGLWYHVAFEGGIISSAIFSVEGRYDLEDDRYYTIAVSDDYYFGTAFPGYKYRNGFNFTFRRSKYEVSLRASVKKYLEEAKEFPFWNQKRGQVSLAQAEESGYKEVHEIQGARHASPYLNKTVTTRGVITAIGTPDRYPWGTELYIESISPDDDLRTSEGLHIHTYRLDLFGLNLKRGDFIEITGTVFEDIRTNGMGDTILRFIKSVKLLKESATHLLPPLMKLNYEGRKIPIKSISTYGGRLMEKTFLNLNDGVDFWESLEGMRVGFKDLVVLGFRGGQEDYYVKASRSYLNLHVTPIKFLEEELSTYHGGLMINHLERDYNPEIFSLITNHLTNSKNLDEEKYYSVGDVFKGEIEGVLIYEKNIFGGGEYALVIPEIQKVLEQGNPGRDSMVSLAERPVTNLVADNQDEVTIATYNVENLSGLQLGKDGDDRMVFMADSIVVNLKCPDIINLVEIQDDNGISLRGSQSAEWTLRKLRALIQSSCLDQNYKMVNVEPFLHGEGGQPGGNIRVSALYNSKKLSIDHRSDGTYGNAAVVGKNGLLTNNPGRVYPLNNAFKRSRRSLVIEFDVLSSPGEKLYLIGNHLNSKLGDMDFWGNKQLARAASDDRRGRKSALINKFVHWLQDENPKANIVVLGDFNALADEDSMKVLTDRETTLQNMIYKLPKNKRYTTNHNGNSQALDYIFVNSRITSTKNPESEILHINSDYMAKLSDHDPVILKIKF